MLPKWLKNILPRREEVANHKDLAWLGTRLHDPDLWHFTQHSASLGVAIGLFIAFVPLPGQMLMAALLCLLLRGNLLLAVGSTWITNPVTFVPINYFIYTVGTLVTGDKNNFVIQESLSWEWLHTIGRPFLIGLPIVAICVSLLGYILINLVFMVTKKSSEN